MDVNNFVFTHGKNRKHTVWPDAPRQCVSRMLFYFETIRPETFGLTEPLALM